MVIINKIITHDEEVLKITFLGSHKVPSSDGIPHIFIKGEAKLWCFH